MLDYEKLYKIIFNGITDAIECMENEGSCLRAKEVLIRAQQKAEDSYIDDGEADSAMPVYILPHDVYADEKRENN